MNCHETDQVSNPPYFFYSYLWGILTGSDDHSRLCPCLLSEVSRSFELTTTQSKTTQNKRSDIIHVLLLQFLSFFNHKIIHKHMLLVLGTNFSIFSYLLISLFSCVHQYLLQVLKYITTATSTPSTTENSLNIRYHTRVLAVLHLPACTIESLGMWWVKGFRCKSHNEQ